MYKIGDIFYDDEKYFDRAMFCNEQGNLRIVEIEPDGNGRRFQIQEIPPLTEEQELEELRQQREVECFSVINRGQLWYNTLTAKQFDELQVWYKAWLDVTETKIIPEKPTWLK